jgi:hypothetical protein
MDDPQDKLLQKEDGRYYAIDKVGTGLGSIATTEWLKKRIVFVRPSLWTGSIFAFGSPRILKNQGH